MLEFLIEDFFIEKMEGWGVRPSEGLPSSPKILKTRHQETGAEVPEISKSPHALHPVPQGDRGNIRCEGRCSQGHRTSTARNDTHVGRIQPPAV